MALKKRCQYLTINSDYRCDSYLLPEQVAGIMNQFLYTFPSIVQSINFQGPDNQQHQNTRSLWNSSNVLFTHQFTETLISPG